MSFSITMTTTSTLSMASLSPSRALAIASCHNNNVFRSSRAARSLVGPLWATIKDDEESNDDISYSAEEAKLKRASILAQYDAALAIKDGVERTKATTALIRSAIESYDRAFLKYLKIIGREDAIDHMAKYEARREAEKTGTD